MKLVVTKKKTDISKTWYYFESR